MRYAALLLLLVACKSDVKMYDGSKGEAARIEPNDIVIHSLDGKRLDTNTSLKRSTLEVAPGKHVIRIEWGAEPNYATKIVPASGAGAYRGTRRVGFMERYRRFYAEIDFEAEAGHTYRGVWVPGEEGRAREPALEDVTSR